MCCLWAREGPDAPWSLALLALGLERVGLLALRESSDPRERVGWLMWGGRLPPNPPHCRCWDEEGG